MRGLVLWAVALNSGGVQAHQCSVGTPVPAPTLASAKCYNNVRTATKIPCDDGNPVTVDDHCKQGACGGWIRLDAVIANEDQRAEWIASDPDLHNCLSGRFGTRLHDSCAGDESGIDVSAQSQCGATLFGHTAEHIPPVCSADDYPAPAANLLFPVIGSDAYSCRNCDCHECSPTFPMYLALSEDQGHGYTVVEKTVASYMKYKHVDEIIPFVPGICLNEADSGNPMSACGWKKGDEVNTCNSIVGGQPGACAGRALFKDTAAGTLRAESQVSTKGYSSFFIWLEDPVHNGVNISLAPHISTWWSVYNGGGYFFAGGSQDAEPCGTAPGHIQAQGAVTDPTSMHGNCMDYRIDTIKEGGQMFTDRSWKITTLPPFLKGLKGILTPDDDRRSDGSAESYLCFTLPYRAVVYVLYDRGSQSRGLMRCRREALVSSGTLDANAVASDADCRQRMLPAWLNNKFSSEHISVVEHDKQQIDGTTGSLNIFYSTFDAGTVCLGGNDPFFPSASIDAPETNYMVVVGPLVDFGRHPSHRVNILNLNSHASTTPIVTPIAQGEKLYTDREYAAQALPPFLTGLEAIKVADSDRNSNPNDASWLCFTVAEAARVYVLYDSLVPESHRPEWLRINFINKHEEVAEVADPTPLFGQPSGAQPTTLMFDIYSAIYPANSPICLGGNGAAGYSSSGPMANYIVFVGPDEDTAFVEGETTASSRYFDGNSDYIGLPSVGTFCDFTLDVWVKFFETTGVHPILTEEGAEYGALRFGIENGHFFLRIAGNPDYFFDTFTVRPNHWYYVTLMYSCAEHWFRLQIAVGDQHDGSSSSTAANPVSLITLEDLRFDLQKFNDPENRLCAIARSDSGVHAFRQCTWPAISLHHARVGGWAPSAAAPTNQSMHGELGMLRIWSFQHFQCTHCTSCFGAGTPGLELFYLMGQNEIGDTSQHDLSGFGRDGAIHGATFSDDTPQVSCSGQGYGGYFDGANDAVKLPDLGKLAEVQIDVWLKLHCASGDHPVLAEEGAEQGAVRLEMHDNVFGLDIVGNGDYTFDYVPPADVWVYVSVFYSSTAKMYKLFVDGAARETYDVAAASRTIHGATRNHAWQLPALPTPGWVSVSLQKASLGYWQGGASMTGPGATGPSMSMDGEIAELRIWSAEQPAATDSCPSSACSQAMGDLVVSYILSASEGSSILRDRSGNNHDATIVGAKYSLDFPVTECVKQQRHLVERDTDMTEACTRGDKIGRSAGFILICLLFTGTAVGFRHFWRNRAAIQKGDGLHASIFAQDDGTGSFAGATPYAPPTATSGSIYGDPDPPPSASTTSKPMLDSIFAAADAPADATAEGAYSGSGDGEGGGGGSIFEDDTI